MRRAFELRFQVYCLERGFLPAQDYPDGVEVDEFDAQAAHFFAFNLHRDLVGYVRLVRPEHGSSFPIEHHCTLSRGCDGLPDPRLAAEVSRLMVRSDYRRSRGDRLAEVTAAQNSRAFAGDRRHETPQILLNLYRQMYGYCREHGVRYLYAAMERPLARSLLRMKFPFRCMGPETDYYGPVAPYLADLREVEAKLAEQRPALLAWMQHEERAIGRFAQGQGDHLPLHPLLAGLAHDTELDDLSTDVGALAAGWN